MTVGIAKSVTEYGVAWAFTRSDGMTKVYSITTEHRVCITFDPDTMTVIEWRCNGKLMN